MTFLAVDTYDRSLRDSIEAAAGRSGVPLSGDGKPLALVRTAKEQEERGTSSEAPLIAVWDPSRGNGGGDPFSYGLLRHLITPKVFESPDRFSAIMRTFEDGATDVRRQVSDEQGETYRARLVDAKARTSFEAAIANDLTKLDVESYASARVIKALVALTSLVGDEHSLSWPVQARFGASTDRVWLQLVSGATLSPEQLLSEFSRGYLGAFKDRERSRVGAMGWFFAFRQVDGMYVGLSSDRTEVLVSWEREPVGWTWKPALHICVAGRQNWRRARRYSVDWRGELNATERRIDAKVLNLSSLGAFVEVAPHAQFETSERVQLELEMPWGGADYAELITLDGAVRYVDPASDGIAIEFHSEARGLGHALERLQLAG